MGSSPVLARLAADGLVFDGPLAGGLHAAGWPRGRPLELAGVEAPDLVLALHGAYRQAGAAVLTANTAAVHRLGAGPALLADRIEELCQASIGLARRAAGPTGLVAAALGPPAGPLYPLGDRSYGAAVAAYRQPVAACRAAGADLFLLEGLTDLLEVQAAVTAARDAGAEPIAVSMRLCPDRLGSGLVSAPALVEVAQALGAAMVGLDGMSAADTARALADLAGRARVPLLARPTTAGPGVAEVLDPSGFAAWGARLRRLGARALGGSEGCTPAHIAALARMPGAARPRIGAGTGRLDTPPSFR